MSAKNWSERTIIALVMQNLDNSITTYTKRGLFGRPQGHQQTGPRTAEPDVDPGGQRGHPTGRGEDRRRRRWHLGRGVQRADDRALPRRLRRSAPTASTASSTPTTACTATRRSASSTVPRCRPTSASTRRSPSPPRPSARLAVAQQGRAGPAPRAGRGLQPDRPDRAEAAGGARTARPPRCGCRSSRSATACGADARSRPATRASRRPGHAGRAD